MTIGRRARRKVIIARRDPVASRSVTALARLVTGRRTKWAVIGAWIVLAFAMSPLAGDLGTNTSDNFASFLPKETESTQVQNLLRTRFAGGETGAGLVVYRRPG